MLYLFIADVSAMTGYPDFFNQCAVGFSGVIFALIAIECFSVSTFALIQ